LPEFIQVQNQIKVSYITAINRCPSMLFNKPFDDICMPQEKEIDST
jgi:hypothetical protein